MFDSAGLFDEFLSKRHELSARASRPVPPSRLRSTGVRPARSVIARYNRSEHMKRSAAAKAAQQASAISLVYFWFHVFFVMSRMVKYDGVSESHLSDAVTSTSQVRFQR